ncbi:hypothetical protein [Pseudomonas sp. LS-2]|uniref:hypothetical protein n=1 Tax=Pseudomonas sp. LS-2 TaxID=2315859 RepID=UPI000E73359F|nr:hypothetical protein [Pseudomonas sp. LS-2]RJX72637.1 hypothetical protein D3M70_31030 [Pseudomonas sp. LS-2]
MNTFPVVVCILVVVLAWLFFTRQRKDIPRQEPTIGSESGNVSQVSPNKAAPAKAAQATLGLEKSDFLALRGASRINRLPVGIDYSIYDEPAYQRLGKTLSFQS